MLYVVLTQLTEKTTSMTTLSTLFYFSTTTLKYHTTFTIPFSDTSHWKILSDCAHYAVSVHCFSYRWDIKLRLVRCSYTSHWETFFWLRLLRFFSPLLLNWEIILRSLQCFSSLLLNWDTALRLLPCLNISHWKIISLKQITEKQYLDYAHYAVLVHCY